MSQIKQHYRTHRISSSTGYHVWVTVVNPTNKRTLLQACDNCGVVRSENTVYASCRAQPNQRLISASLQTNLLRIA